jgi:quercetin dioxygenase-like cupin family protein
VHIIRLDASAAEPIGPRPYAVEKTASVKILEGSGEAHAYVLEFEPGGTIGPHEAGFGQLFVALSGSGWVAGADGERVALAEGEAALFPRGEMHSKGSERGMTALMVQVRDLVRPQMEH